MQVKIKKLYPDAHIPTRMHDGDAGYDLYSREVYVMKPGEVHVFKTGIAIEIDQQYVALIWGRGSMAIKGADSLAGVVDSNFRGDIGVVLQNNSPQLVQINAGDRIAQLLFQRIELPQLVEVEELTDTDRGAGAFGSTNKKLSVQIF